MSTKKCYQCGKTFLVHLPLEWAYRITSGSPVKFFCSYSCIQQYREGVQHRREEWKRTYYLRKRKKEETTNGRAE